MERIVTEPQRISVDHDTIVRGVLVRPHDAKALLVLAHGAGTDFDHPAMNQLAEALTAHQIATLRFNFVYREVGRRRPDPPALAHRTVRAAVAHARVLAPELPLLAGGRSFGGRMTSQAQSEDALADVSGIVFFAFPLHPPKKPGIERADHLTAIEVPLLFLSGTRDPMAPVDTLRGVVDRLEQAQLHWLDAADHSFKVLKRSGRTEQEVLDEAAETTRSFALALAS